MRSPRSSSGAAVTAASRTAGCSSRRDLDLARADLVAAGLDQVRRPAADDAPVAVGRAGADVAGEEPAVADRLGGRVGAVEVAREQVRAAHRDLADRLVVGLLDVGAVVGDQPHLDARHGDADVAGAARGVRAGGGVHQRLGEAVALDDLLPGEALDALELGGGQRRRAGDEQARRLQPLDDPRVRLRLAADPVVHRRDAEQHRGAVARAPARRPPARSGRGGAAHRRGAAARACRARARGRGTAAARGRARPLRSTPRRRRARRGWRRPRGASSTAPFGRPVVPLVYTTSAGSSSCASWSGSSPPRADVSTARPSGPPRITSGELSESTCSSSLRPSFGFTGTQRDPRFEHRHGGDDRLQARLGPHGDPLGARELPRRAPRPPRAAPRTSAPPRRPRRRRRRPARGRAPAVVRSCSEAIPAAAGANRSPRPGRPRRGDTAAAASAARAA